MKKAVNHSKLRLRGWLHTHTLFPIYTCVYMTERKFDPRCIVLQRCCSIYITRLHVRASLHTSSYIRNNNATVLYTPRGCTNSITRYGVILLTARRSKCLLHRQKELVAYAARERDYAPETEKLQLEEKKKRERGVEGN